MSQQLIHLKPENLFPRWASMLDYVQEISKQHLEHSVWNSLISQKARECNLDIGDSRFCVVGEAHKFSNDYDDDDECITCSNHYASYFISLFHDLKHGLVHDWRRESSSMTRKFLVHFQQAHS